MVLFILHCNGCIRSCKRLSLCFRDACRIPRKGTISTLGASLKCYSSKLRRGLTGSAPLYPSTRRLRQRNTGPRPAGQLSTNLPQNKKPKKKEGLGQSSMVECLPGIQRPQVHSLVPQTHFRRKYGE